MAIVKKCDVCSEIYPMDTKEPTMDIIEKNKIDDLSFVWGESEVNCCPECTKKIDGFIRVIRQYGDHHCVTVFDNAGEEHEID